MKILKKIGKALAIVIHDPAVQRSGKQFAAKILARLALTGGGVAFFAELAAKFLN